MKYSSFLFGSIAIGVLTNTTYAMDTEQTPLVKSHDSELELVVIEDAINIQKAYGQGLRANKEGYLVFIHQNLSSCAGLSALQDKLHLNTITYLNFSNNKLQEVPADILATMPNLMTCDLSHNHITKICDPIPPHQKLKTLLLQHNELTQFPLEQFLQSVALKQLTLNENRINGYGLLRADHPSLEELWIDNNVQTWVKQMIAYRCPNLTAEMCEGDTTVQDAHTKTEYSATCQAQFCSLNHPFPFYLTGVAAGGLFSLTAALTCRFLIPHFPVEAFAPMAFSGSSFGLGIGQLIGSLRGYYYLNPEERYTKTILKQIAKYPPIIETLRKQAQFQPKS